MSIDLRVMKLSPTATLPTRGTERSAGLDLYADFGSGDDDCSPDREPIVIRGGKGRTIRTGIAIGLPPGHEGQIRPRSGNALKHGVTVLNSPSTIDEDYRGEVVVLLINHGTADFIVNHGDRIAQLVVAPVAMVSVVEVEGLDDTDRGTAGFGSTGR